LHLVGDLFEFYDAARTYKLQTFYDNLKITWPHIDDLC